MKFWVRRRRGEGVDIAVGRIGGLVGNVVRGHRPLPGGAVDIGKPGPQDWRGW